jgi:hypothetical protein
MRELMGLPCSQSSASFATGGVTLAAAALSACTLFAELVTGALLPLACSLGKVCCASSAVLTAVSGVQGEAAVLACAGLRVCVGGRAEDRLEERVGWRLLVLAAAGLADGVSALSWLFPDGLEEGGRTVLAGNAAVMGFDLGSGAPDGSETA